MMPKLIPGTSLSLGTINGIDIREVLQTLHIHYNESSGVLTLFDGDNETDGRRGNVGKNFINDFSENGRAIGGPYSFVKQYLKTSNYETYEWFKNNFMI